MKNAVSFTLRTEVLKNLHPLVTYPLTDSRILQLHKLVSQYGLLRPLIVSEDNYILDGNKLHMVLITLGYTEAPVWVLSYGSSPRHPLDTAPLWNLHTILNVRLPYTYGSAIDPLLDTLRLELAHTIKKLLPDES